MKKSLSYILLSLFLMAVSCNDEEFPDPTTDGKNTFGCYINGDEFRVKGGLTKKSVDAQYYHDMVREIHITGLNIDRDKFGVVVLGINYDSLLSGTRVFSLGTDQHLTDYSIHPTRPAWGSTGLYVTDTSLSGSVKITRFDNKEEILSGTFEFDAVNPSGEKAEVRKGRFDVALVGQLPD
ncbi:hypothetical protein FUAX_54850 (plasmid) [Fulvitalea axinellae]|uniref:Uncharacterized protein n=1 Tax=Fulvitalea axinellae TaxID=1182444 RepID=A0AAU9CYM7_9BACT|nr:hypothetical protein FUAX_54850 [Fulvitalea axinellae]